jgi:hypothetical protein
VRALPAPKAERRKGARQMKPPVSTPKSAARPAKGKGSRPRVTPETIARIQAMDGQGKPIGEIAAACGVSTPTVKKYADMKPVPRSAGNGAPIAAAPAKRPWV